MFIKNPGDGREKIGPRPKEALPESGGFIGRGPGNVNLDGTKETYVARHLAKGQCQRAAAAGT